MTELSTQCVKTDKLKVTTEVARAMIKGGMGPMGKQEGAQVALGTSKKTC